MKKSLTFLFALLVLMGCNSKKPSASNEEPTNTAKVLFLCTSTAKYNGLKNGTYLQEVAIPVYELNEKGIEIDIGTPKGGSMPLYHKFDTTEALQIAMTTEYFLSKSRNSKKLSQIDITDYSAIIIPGGYGQFVDLHGNELVAKMIVSHYENNGIIGSLGHGTALLAPLKLSTGNYLVNGVTMTCFPNYNEKKWMTEADHGKLLPFFMEDELKKNGADLKIYDHEKKINFEIIDSKKRIVTAAFADGGEFVATKVAELISVK